MRLSKKVREEAVDVLRCAADLLLVERHECPHAFHERTKQQASYDRARDREMLRRGLAVVRFTGSDIVRDAEQCANECVLTLNAIEQRHDDIGTFAFRAARESQNSAVGSSSGLVG